MNRPFSGMRVLDLTHVLAGPHCTYMLALLGADTIKIEAPGEPDEVRGRGADPALNEQLLGTNYLTQGANKKAITLNLKTAAGREVFLRLARQADVIVENYRAGALAELGLGYEAIRAFNPNIVYCSLTGYGQSGPRATVNAYDNVIQAASGLMAMTGTKEAHPIKTGASIIDYAAGMSAAFAIAAALLRRERHGAGTYIDCAMLDTALMLMGTQVTAAYAGAEAPTPKGNEQKEAGLGCYETADGLLMLGAFNRRQHERLWQAFERPDFAVLSSWSDMAAHAPAMRAELTRRLQEKSAADWETYLHGIGVPAERVRTVNEALQLVAAQQRAFTAPLALTANGSPVRVPLTPFTFSEGGAALDTAPPCVGEHTDSVLTAFGYDPAQIAKLRQQGAI